jgi:penicillin-binding protein 1A
MSTMTLDLAANPVSELEAAFAAPRGEPEPDPWKLLRWLARFLALVAGTVLGVLGLAALAQHFTEVAVRSASDAVAFDVLLPEITDFGPLAERSVVYSQDGTPIATLHDEINRREVPIDDLPEHVWRAVLVAEDRRFFEHDGYDIEGIGRAALANLRAGGITQGGSTITQQLAKIAVGDDVTFERKFEELMYAIGLEHRYSKEQLLERYLNEVYFGAGAYGIAAAAEEFFAVPPERLRVEEAALLASLLRSPGALDPRRNPDGARLRRDAVLHGMVAEGFLEHSSADLLASLPLGVVPARDNAPLEPYIVEAVKQEFFSNPAFGETRADRIRLLFGGGLQVYTTIEPELQRRAQRVVRDHFPASEGVTAAIASVDPRTGEIKAAAFGRDFDTEQFNLALQGRRQPGSAFKPFVLTAALERGFPTSLTLQGRSPAYFEGVCGWARRDPDGCSTDPGSRGVRNFGNASYGRLELREALVRSVNTAFAQLVLAVGPEHVVDTTMRLGVSERAYGGERNPAIALGGLRNGISPMEMAVAYGTLANGGLRHTPHVIARVVDDQGNEIYTSNGNPEQVVSPEVSAVVSDMMLDVVQRGTGTRAALPGWQIAGKTGTTQENRDVWFVGTTPVLSTAVWIGNPDVRETLIGMSSSATAAPIWREFMEQALDGVEPVPFPAADADVSQLESGEQVHVPDLANLQEYEALQAVVSARLVPEVRQVNNSAARGTVVSQQPSAGGTATAGDRVVVSVSTGYVPPPPPPEPEPTPTPEPTPEPEPEPDD